MAEPKQFYQRNKEEVNRALAILKSDTLENAIHFAKAEMACRYPTAEQMAGANLFANILLSIADLDQEYQFPGSGLNHDFELKPKEWPKEKTPNNP